MKTLIKTTIAVAIIFGALLMYTANKEGTVEIPQAEYTYDYHYEDFEAFKNTDRAELILKEDYLMKEWRILSEELDRIQSELRPNALEEVEALHEDRVVISQ